MKHCHEVIEHVKILTQDVINDNISFAFLVKALGWTDLLHFFRTTLDLVRICHNMKRICKKKKFSVFEVPLAFNNEPCLVSSFTIFVPVQTVTKCLITCNISKIVFDWIWELLWANALRFVRISPSVNFCSIHLQSKVFGTWKNTLKSNTLSIAIC